MQVLALALALQISGFAHRLADLVFQDDCAADCGREPLDDADGDSECPPGCPTCHACAHAQSLYVPGAVAMTGPPLTEVSEPPRAASDPPPDSFHASLFRPPRG